MKYHVTYMHLTPAAKRRAFDTRAEAEAFLAVVLPLDPEARIVELSTDEEQR